ncbi:hypothetical protein EYF80_026914 [Liparis tanakae]|uniref:Uncharacterized protein n=1 Tax=Liparis tanakae TaxID=230148 RepID=A0A4Z2HAJ6_9TELE|nr:hypothetical protein EYF80_026914 [Liparis tanakae]
MAVSSSRGDARGSCVCARTTGLAGVCARVAVYACFGTAKANAQRRPPLIGWRALTEGGAAQEFN